jgi:deoxycytidylate deaminase
VKEAWRKVNLRWFNLARRMATLSQHKGYRMAAVAVQGGRVISSSINGVNVGQHAERRALRHPGIKGSTVYVARDDGGISRPCIHCQARLIQAGVSRVVYAGWDGKLIMECI